MSKALTDFMEQARARKKEMRRLRAQGWTFQQIGEQFGISYQRVQQILGKA